MSMAEPLGPAARKLAARVRGLLLRPSAAWAEIEAEPTSVRDVLRGHVAVLAAIPAVCRLVGVLIFGDSMMGIGLRPPIGLAVVEALASYGLTLAIVWLIARLIDLAAPTFGGARSPLQAYKLAGFSGTALWVTGVFQLYPPVGGLAVLLGGLYSLYLLYLGLPRLMAAALEHRVSYFAVILLTVLVLAVLSGTVTARIREAGGPLHVAMLQASPA